MFKQTIGEWVNQHSDKTPEELAKAEKQAQEHWNEALIATSANNRDAASLALAALAEVESHIRKVRGDE